MEQKVATIDIESNGLLADMLDYSSFPYKLKPEAKLWVVSITYLNPFVTKSFVKEEITKEALAEALEGIDILVAHNGIKFDFITLMLFGLIDYKVGYLGELDELNGKSIRLIDSLILSRLSMPDRLGGHSLDAWGKRVGVEKTDYRKELIELGVLDKNSPKGFEFTFFHEKMVHYCITPDMRLLDENLIWREAETFKIGDTVLGFDEESEDNRKGRRYKSAVIEKITEDYAEVFQVKLSSGKVLKVTEEHRFLTSTDNHGYSSYKWVETRNLQDTRYGKNASKLPCLLPVFEKEDSFEAGWLSGIFDGEGHITNGKGRPPRVSVSQRPTQVLENIENGLTRRGFNLTKRNVSKGSDCVTISVTGGFSEHYRLLSTIRPQRLINKLDFNTLGRLELRGCSFNDTVESITPIGIQKILKIQTTSSTFLCEGYPMHNCNQDTITNAYVYADILKEYKGYTTASNAIRVEHKLADLAVRRESLGFWFDKELALKNLEELTQIMNDIQDRVNPILPKKPFTQTELDYYTPTSKKLKKDGTLTTHFENFCNKLNIEVNVEQNYFIYKGSIYPLDHEMPLEKEREATVDDLDTVKGFLLDLGWNPSEWGERDLTRDSKKQALPLDKKIKALERYCKDTLESGKYKKQRLEILGVTESNMFSKLRARLTDRSLKVPTAPKIRVGVTKDMCPNLVELGETVSFAKDVADYYTYRHRKSAIAGGDIEDMDFDEETPNTGYLAQYREVDGRIPTPAIEIGANTFRYKHIGVANVPRTSSLFGDKMRALFGAGKEFIQFGFDYSSLEARVQGNFVFNYEGGKELADSLLAEKPFDIHSLMAEKLGISRTDSKSVNYMFMYGGSANKVEKMLGYSKDKAIEFHKDWWETMLPLKQLKEDKEKEWIESGKKFVKTLDGRRVNIRSQHSIINALFQSSGVIFAKYVTVILSHKLEKLGYCIDVFKSKPDIAELISYHDEAQLGVNKDLLKYKVFNTEEEAEEFVVNWKGEQLGAIQKGSNNKYYVTLPSVISTTLSETISEVEAMFDMNVTMGFEYVTGRNWRDCH